MGGFSLATQTVPTPVAGNVIVYPDSADKRAKAIDENGVISILNNDGLQDRNTLINGDFRILQRVLAASTAIAGISTTTRVGQVADQWAVTASVASNLNFQQVDTAGAAEAGLNSRYYASIISASAGKKVMLSQIIINADMAYHRGKKVRVSVKVKQKVGAAQNYRLGLLQLTASGTVDVCPAFLQSAWSVTTGVDPVWGTNLVPIVPDNPPLGENGTIAGNWLVIATTSGWVRSSAVFSIPTDAKNLVVVLFSDATGASTDNISIAEAQLTQGPDIVDWVSPPLTEELLKCQQFFCKSFPMAIVPAVSVTVANGGYGASSIQAKTGSGAVNGCFIPIQFPVPMWKVPAITLYTPTAAGALVYRHTGATPAVQGATTIQANATTEKGTIITCTNEATANGVVGDLMSIHYSAEAGFIT
jgi:hypothetical protein